jgi:hypothetical protein
MAKAYIYVDGKLTLTVFGYQSESEIDLWKRVKGSIMVVVPPDKPV